MMHACIGLRWVGRLVGKGGLVLHDLTATMCRLANAFITGAGRPVSCRAWFDSAHVGCHLPAASCCDCALQGPRRP